MAKILPDRRLPAVSIPQLDSEHISSLCNNYSINDVHVFSDSVRQAVRMYLLVDRSEKEKQQKEKIGEKKDLIKTIHTNAAMLRECISKLSSDDYQDLGGYDFIDQVEENILHLESYTKVSLSHLSGQKGKKKRNDAFHMFVQDVYKIYKDVTGACDRYVYDSKNNEYSGSFFEFIKEIMQYIDVNKTDSALASDITSALKEIS